MVSSIVSRSAVIALVLAFLPSIPPGFHGPLEAAAQPILDMPYLKHYMPTINGPHSGGPQGNSGPLGPGSGNLLYFGGSVQTVPHIYLIFWGFNIAAVDDPSGEANYLTRFFNGVSGSSWADIQNQYYQGSSPKTYITDPVAPAPQFNPLTDTWYDNDPTSLPGVIPDVMLASEALRAATHFGYSANADYFIATPHGRNTVGFAVPSPVQNSLVGYCAYHSMVSSSLGPVAYTNLPYQTDAALGVCGANFVNPGTPGLLDGVSIVGGHEYAETVTDPGVGSGWIDSAGAETGDKCAWRTTGSGHTQDIVLSTGTFAVQGLWSNENSDCVIGRQYTASAGGSYSGLVSTSIPIAATATGGVGANSCTWSGAGATFGNNHLCSTTVSFATTGPQSISVAMTDSAVPAHSASDTAAVDVYAALTASAGGPYAGVVGSSIPIAGSYAGGHSPYSCLWSGAGATFGDATACSTTVSYSTAGSKSVSLQVTDGSGSTATGTATVTVSSAALAADAHGPYAGSQGIPISISGSGSGGSPPYTCHWSGGAAATFANPSACATSVTYSAAGPDTLTLTVTDSLAATATSTAAVTVASTCATGPAGNSGPIPDPLGLYDLTKVCGKRGGGAVQLSIVTTGLSTENLLGNAVDPVTYVVQLNSAPFPWYFTRAAGTWVVASENSGGLSAATGSASSTEITLSIPASEAGSATGFHVSTAIAGNSQTPYIEEDAIPAAGYQPF